MKTQILISINNLGLKDISLVAETEQECERMMETYHRFEPEIVDFVKAMRQKTGAVIQPIQPDYPPSYRNN
jgi:hypothetical protein|tara:strand:+ start:843 stop:1055 length:213 start_codon:yes stop_codon:yes gene_type:complete